MSDPVAPPAATPPSRVGELPPASAPPARSWGFGAALFLIGMLFAATSLSGYWAFWQLRQASQERLEFARQLAAQRGQSQALDTALARAQQQLREERQQRLRQRQELAERLQRQQLALDALAQKLREPARALMSQWRMETARILLSGVGAQLAPGNNVAAAQRLLGNALDLLAPLADLQLVAVRRAIKADQAALAAMRMPDLLSYRRQLGQHIAAIDTLPLRARPVAKAPPQTASGGDGAVDTLSARLWSRLGPAGDWLARAQARVGTWFGPLVKVRRAERGEAPLRTAPPAVRHLRGQLRLRLEQAQLALPQREAQAVNAAASRAADWLARHFDADSRQVGQLRALLGHLAQLQFTELPFREPTALRALDALLGATHPGPLNPTATGAPMP